MTDIQGEKYSISRPLKPLIKYVVFKRRYKGIDIIMIIQKKSHKKIKNFDFSCKKASNLPLITC